jgi:hypothetical protein
MRPVPAGRRLLCSEDRLSTPRRLFPVIGRGSGRQALFDEIQRMFKHFFYPFAPQLFELLPLGAG